MKIVGNVVVEHATMTTTKASSGLASSQETSFARLLDAAQPDTRQQQQRRRDLGLICVSDILPCSPRPSLSRAKVKSFATTLRHSLSCIISTSRQRLG